MGEENTFQPTSKKNSVIEIWGHGAEHLSTTNETSSEASEIGGGVRQRESLNFSLLLY